ncbi:MAG: hypothetical protein QW279_09875 [Candidatus Jordarchaeaceae archaeon]
MNVHRPSGVIALSVIYIVIAGLGIAGVSAIQTIILPSDYQGLDWWILVSFYLLGKGINPIAALGGISNPIFAVLQRIDSMNILSWGAAIFSVLSLSVGVSLLSMRNWARIFGLFTGTILIIMGILSFLFYRLFISTYGLLGIIFIILGCIIFQSLGILTIVYLAGDVKYEFQ